MTGLRATKMLHTSFAHFFQTRLRASSFSAVATRPSRKMCVFSLSLLNTSLCEHALNITQMYDDGYRNIVNVDVRSCPDCYRLSMWSLMAFSHTQYSAVVIEQMAARNHNRPEMQCTFRSLPHISKSKEHESLNGRLLCRARDGHP